MNRMHSCFVLRGLGFRRWLLVAMSMAGMSSGAVGSPSVSGEIETLVRDFMAVNHVPGLSIGVLSNGDVALARGFGNADLQDGTPASERTLYPLASLTKQFTATAVTLLAHKGKLSLDDAVSRHIEGLPEAWRAITIRQLLNHTSGIPDLAATANFARLSTRRHKAREVLKWVRNEALAFAPGEGWKYSNTNYFLLGLIIERTSGDSYGTFLTEQIFRPLDMDSTRLDSRGRLTRHHARGYVWKGGEWRLAARADPSVAYAAGGIVGTVWDFLKWQRALQERTLLPAASLAQMWSPTTTNGQHHAYGFGWRIHAKQQCVSHSGHVQGAAAFMASCPARKFAVVLLANLEHVDLEPLSGRIAEVYGRP